MKTLTEQQAAVLCLFLGEHWAMFEARCDEYGLSEDEANELYEALGGE